MHGEILINNFASMVQNANLLLFLLQLSQHLPFSLLATVLNEIGRAVVRSSVIDKKNQFSGGFFCGLWLLFTTQSNSLVHCSKNAVIPMPLALMPIAANNLVNSSNY